ncbi:MAG: hypothetical protein K8T90_00025 [Planctomycetes bacterium]|nr:hypothetical protein [Planctomycetota bacterium]
MTSLLLCVLLAASCALAAASPRLRLAALIGAAGVLSVFAWRFAIVPEDTFISMRYARHLAGGNGLVYNAGERVEGYTNFLWTLVLALVEVVGTPPLKSAVALSIAAGVGVVVLLHRSVRRLADGADVVPFMPAALILLPAFWDGAGSGLETAFYALFVTWAVAVQTVAMKNGRAPDPWRLAIPLVCAVLTRPEGALVAGLVVGGALLTGPRDAAFRRRQLVALGVAAFVCVAHFTWRKAYYGEWLPNTFHCKVGATSAQVRRGFEQFLQFLRTGNGLLLLPCAAAPWLLRKRPWLGPPLVVGTVYTAYVIAVGGDNFWRHRYLVPVLPSLFLVSELVARDVLGTALAALPRAAKGATAAAAVFLLWGSVDGIKIAPNPQSHDARFAPLRELGEWLTANTPPGRSIGVLAAGATPYYTDRPCIDMLGLNDHHIARVVPPDPVGTRNAGHEKYDFDYVLSRDPEFVLMAFSDRADPNNLLWVSEQRDPTLRTRWLSAYEHFTIKTPSAEWRVLRKRR